MANETITRKCCGKTDTVQVYGPVADRDRKAAWIAANVPCADCKAKARAAEAAKAAADNADAGLPALTGSPKQIAWAETIRAKMLAAVADRLAAEYAKGVAANVPAAKLDAARALTAKVTANLQAHADSRYWIDNRETPVMALIKSAM